MKAWSLTENPNRSINSPQRHRQRVSTRIDVEACEGPIGYTRVPIPSRPASDAQHQPLSAEVDGCWRTGIATAAPVGRGCETNPVSVEKWMLSIVVGSPYSRSARRRCRRRLPDPAATSNRSDAGRDLTGTTVARGGMR